MLQIVEMWKEKVSIDFLYIIKYNKGKQNKGDTNEGTIWFL